MRLQEYHYYLETFRKHGLYHPLNWYRTRRINHEEEQAARLGPVPAHIPALMIPAEKDPALPPAMADNPAVRKCFSGNLRVLPPIKGGDHWVLQVIELVPPGRHGDQRIDGPSSAMYQDVRYCDQVTRMLADFVDEVLAGKWQPNSPPAKL